MLVIVQKVWLRFAGRTLPSPAPLLPLLACGMRRVRLPWPGTALFVGLWCCWPVCQAAESSRGVVVTAPEVGPSLQEIVQRAIADDELRRRHRQAYECDQTIITDRLDNSGGLIKTKTVTRIDRERLDVDYNGLDAATEPKRRQEDGDTLKARHRMASMNLRRLAPFFRYSLEPDATLRGQACYVLQYTPAGNAGAASAEDKAISQLHGRVWIARKTYEILQAEGSLPAPVRVATFASVSRLDFALHTQTLPNGEAGPADFSLDFTVQAPFYFYRQRQWNRFEHWRLAP